MNMEALVILSQKVDLSLLRSKRAMRPVDGLRDGRCEAAGVRVVLSNIKKVRAWKQKNQAGFDALY